MNSDIVSLIIILICVMLSAYFSATETSFTSLNRIRMKNMAEKGDKRAEPVSYTHLDVYKRQLQSLLPKGPPLPILPRISLSFS